MRKLSVLAVVLVMSFAVSCGGGGSSTDPGTPPVIPPAQNYTSISGNWGVTATSAMYSQTITIGGALVSNGSSVTGTIHFLSIEFTGTSIRNCIDSSDLPVSGTIDANNNVSLTSSAFNGQVLTATMVAAANGKTMQGTYKITGGCIGNEQGTFQAATYADANGSWSGSVTSASPNSTAVPVTATISQSLTANAHGVYPVTGSVTFTGSPCFTTAQITAGTSALGSFLAGGYLSLYLSAADSVTGAPVTIIVSGQAKDATSKSMDVDYDVKGGSCDRDWGTGTITRP